MNSVERYLAFDLGAESGRAMIGAFDGEEISVEEILRFPNGAVELLGRLHWDTLQLFSGIKNGLQLGLAGHPDLASIGVNSWGVDFALLDDVGALIGNPYSYRDRRSKAGFDIALKRIGRDEIFRQTGIQVIEVNTLFQLAAMRAEQPYALDSAASFLMIADLFNYWLSGERVAEHMLATTSQCIDVSTRSWARELVSQLGVPLTMFPDIVEPGTTLGPLDASMRAELGLSETPSVVATASHDTGASITATPLSSTRSAFVSSGTWVMVGAEVQKPIVTATTERFNFTNEAGIDGTFQFLKNLMGLWLLQECRRAWQARGAALSYDDLMSRAATAKPFAAVLDPEWEDFLAPGDMPSRIAAHCREAGFDIDDEPGTLARVILEGIALDIRRSLNMLAEVRGYPADAVHINGGGVRNRLLCQMIADASNTPVVAGPAEGAVLGNLACQAIARGRIEGLQQVRDVVARSVKLERYEPNPAVRAQWDAAIEGFLQHAATVTYEARE